MRGFWILIVCLCFPLHAYGQEIADQKVGNEQTVTIGNIYITGNKKTRNEIIERELDFEVGQKK